jgi:predicted MFS family arabinose efflux permease
MTIARSRPFGQKYAFVVVAIAFISLLVGAGQRAAPGVLIVPLEQAFGWGRDVTSLSAAMGIFLYGLVGPFAAALMQSFGVRRTLLCALALMSAASGASAWMTEPWHLFLSWGVFSGVATGCVAVVFGATVINRWFVKHRGLMMGILTASTATGTLVFLPGMAALVESDGWRSVVIVISVVCLALVPLAWWLMPERPSDIGLVPYGADPHHDATPAQINANPLKAAFGALGRAVGMRNFWFLFATFFICGFTTNGLIGTHFIAMCSDQGIPEVRAAGLLAMMGLFDLVGTTASGWLTDRYDPRKLLFMYYGLRGASLMFLPFSDFSIYSLGFFAVFYGLDWIATVPPTLRLAVESFGERDAPIVFGWIVAGHQLGAASAAFMAGALRQAQGNYLLAFVISGATGIVAAVIALQIRKVKMQQVPAVA